MRRMSPIDFRSFDALTFDCYGTLIDWESGILAALRPIIENHHREVSDEKLLELYGSIEVQAEAGEYRSYRRILQYVTQRIASRLSFALYEGEIDALPNSLKD